MLRGVAGSRHHLQSKTTHRQIVALHQRLMIKPQMRLQAGSDRRPGQRRNLARAGDEVGVQVCLQHVDDVHPEPFCRLQVAIHVAQGVDHHRQLGLV